MKVEDSTPGLFHIVSINERTLEVVILNSDPLTHREACTMLSKFGSQTPGNRRQLFEVGHPRPEWTPLDDHTAARLKKEI